MFLKINKYSCSTHHFEFFLKKLIDGKILMENIKGKYHSVSFALNLLLSLTFSATRRAASAELSCPIYIELCGAHIYSGWNGTVTTLRGLFELSLDEGYPLEPARVSPQRFLSEL